MRFRDALPQLGRIRMMEYAKGTMRAQHDTMLVRIVSTIAPGFDRAHVVRTGATLQQVLSDVLGLATDDVVVRVNGRSVSRLQVLLPGDRIDISSAVQSEDHAT